LYATWNKFFLDDFYVSELSFVSDFQWGHSYGVTKIYLSGFSAHGFVVNGFLFLVKELWLLTNPSDWVRILDVASSYMYIVL
jgi:hypothetical protein